MSYGATPYEVCACITCGPPWRDERPRPDQATDWAGYAAWGSWMALCPRCGSKRCDGAVNHDLPCFTSAVR